MKFTINNRLILEVYEQTGVKQEFKNGLAIAGQRDGFKGLKLLAPARLQDGTVIPEGSTAWFTEAKLYSQPFTKQIFKSDSISQPFIITDLSIVDMLETLES